MKRIFSTGLFVAALAGVSAQAATIFSLTQDGCSGTGGCGAGPYGTISLVQNGMGTSATVTVTETLAANENFAGTGAGDALDFNVSGPITVSNLTTGFSLNPDAPPYSASAFGSFLDSITCTTCQGGNGPIGPLTFTVSSAAGVTIGSFTGNTGGYFFAADIAGIVDGHTNTGNVAAIEGGGGGGSATPEPATFIPMSSALIGALLYVRRKRKARA